MCSKIILNFVQDVGFVNKLVFCSMLRKWMTSIFHAVAFSCIK